MKKLSITSWAIDDRPREKLVLKGRDALSAAELVAILIGSGNRDETAVGLSQRILETVQYNLNKLAKLSVAELQQFKGIGEAKAVSIITALELGKRRQFEEKGVKVKVNNSTTIFKLMQPVFSGLEHEEFWCVYLNNANTVVGKQQLSKGGLTATMVDVRLLYKRALELLAVGIIVCHNHPSGTLQPSTSDRELTQKISAAGAILDIKLLDHVILAENAYFSFADDGIL